MGVNAIPRDLMEELKILQKTLRNREWRQFINRIS